MMFGAMTPDDVFAFVDRRTDRTFYTLCVVACLVILKLIGDVKMYLENRKANRERKESAKRTEGRINRVLDMIEGHGQITDNQVGRFEGPLKEIKQGVEEVKSRLAGNGHGNGGSSTNIVGPPCP